MLATVLEAVRARTMGYDQDHARKDDFLYRSLRRGAVWHVSPQMALAALLGNPSRQNVLPVVSLEL